MNNIQLNRSEQIGVVLSAVAVMATIFMGMYTFAGPRRAYTKSQAEVTGLVDQLNSFRSLKQQEEQRLARQETLMKVLAARPAGFNLFSFVDETIGKLELRGFANTTNAPRGRGDAKVDKLALVQLELKGVGLKQILDVLHALYASNNLIAVQRMDRLAPSQSTGNGLDCTFILATLKT